MAGIVFAPSLKIRTADSVHSESMTSLNRLSILFVCTGNICRSVTAEGVFRSDLPASWLVATLHNVLHGAADEINAGRLKPEDAARTVSVTILAAFAAR